MRKIVFDIETLNTFEDIGKNEPALLDMSVIGVYDSETNKYTCYEVPELPQLWPILERADVLIGYNSDHFDIPCLNRYYPGDLTKLRSIDLMKSVQASLGRRLKLDTLAQATLGTAKSGYGLQAITWWKNGEYQKVKDYCIDDVKITKKLYDYALKHGHLKYHDGIKVQKHQIDTSTWEPDVIERVALTHTLPF